MQIMDEKFVHIVDSKIEDCSNPVQLSAYLRQFSGYVFVPAIAEMFYTKNNYFKDLYKTDSLFTEACEDIEDMLDIDIQIANVCKNGLISEHQNDNDMRLIKSLINDQILEVSTISYKDLRKEIKHCEGNTKQTAKNLGITLRELKYLIKYYNLYKYIDT